MRIAIFEGHADITAGGAEKSMASFCDYLVETGHDVFLICERKGDYSFKGISVKGCLEINTQPLKAQGTVNYGKSVFTMARFLRKHRINLVLTHTIHAFATLRLLKLLTGCQIMVYFKWIYYGDNLGLLSSWGIKGLDRAIAINAYVADYWSKFTSSAITDLVPDGIPVSGSFPLNEIDKRLLFLGRIYEGKGLHLLIEAMELLDNNYVLDVVGFFDPEGTHANTGYHRKIKKLAASEKLRGRIKFHGLQNDLEPFYSTASLIIVPSVWADAQPLVILEAMAGNKIVIGSAVGGIPLIFSGELECLCFLPDKFALAQKIKEIINLDYTEKNILKQKLNKVFNDIYRADLTQKKLEQLLN